jgi:ketosteroid isomerase-like protein
MTEHSINSSDVEIRRVLENWALSTKTGRKDDVLSGHRPDVLIYDVLAPMKYEGAAAYRASWDDWQPDTQGEGVFQLEELKVTADQHVAFAHGILRCGGALANGKSFEDLVRVTFCLTNEAGSWKVAHQHFSKPI